MAELKRGIVGYSNGEPVYGLTTQSTHTDRLLQVVLEDAERKRRFANDQCERLQSRMRHLLEVKRHTQEEIERLSREIKEHQAEANVQLETIRECRKDLAED